MATTPSTPPMEAPKPKSRRTMYAVIGAVVVIVIVVVALYLGGYILGSSGTPVTINDDGTCAANATTCNYSPASVPISKGGSVTWTNSGTVTGGHTVTSNSTSSQTFSLTLSSNGAKGTVSFPNAGTFGYYCTIHPWMKGQVVVT